MRYYIKPCDDDDDNDDASTLLASTIASFAQSFTNYFNLRERKRCEQFDGIKYCLAKKLTYVKKKESGADLRSNYSMQFRRFGFFFSSHFLQTIFFENQFSNMFDELQSMVIRLKNAM